MTMAAPVYPAGYLQALLVGIPVSPATGVPMFPMVPIAMKCDWATGRNIGKCAEVADEQDAPMKQLSDIRREQQGKALRARSGMASIWLCKDCCVRWDNLSNVRYGIGPY